jgi:hypothetical protein
MDAAARTAESGRQKADELDQQRWFRSLARIGLLSRAVIYLLLAYLCADIAARGSSPTPADSQGALAEVARQPAGPGLLALLAVGLLAYAVWRLISAVAVREWPKRLGAAASGLIYLLLCAEAVAQAVGSGSSGSSTSSNPGPVVARVLTWPGGPPLVGAVATGLVIGGVALAVWGCLHDESKVLRVDTPRGAMLAARWTGAIGDAVRGGLIVLLGGYLMASAVKDTPAEVKGLDQALQSLSGQPYGRWILIVATAGLVAFAANSAFEAAYRRV